MGWGDPDCPAGLVLQLLDFLLLVSGEGVEDPLLLAHQNQQCDAEEDEVDQEDDAQDREEVSDGLVQEDVRD